jgi:hypothetical protein
MQLENDTRRPGDGFPDSAMAEEGYAAMPIRGGWRRSPLFDCSFRLTRERDRMGYWEYNLETDVVTKGA